MAQPLIYLPITSYALLPFNGTILNAAPFAGVVLAFGRYAPGFAAFNLGAAILTLGTVTFLRVGIL